MKVRELINQLNNTSVDTNKKVYNTKSEKTEIEVMKTMMNDTTYSVDVYNNKGYVNTYNPGKNIRDMFSNVISNTCGISKLESDLLMKKYEFNNDDAKEMVNFSKEYINTYLFEVGKKMKLGGRKDNNICLKEKEVPAGFVKYPAKVGKSTDGKYIYEFKETYIPKYKTLNIEGTCPPWLLNR